MTFSSLLVEQPAIILGTPFQISPIEWVIFAAMYVTLGYYAWERMFLKPSEDDLQDDAFLALAVAETCGSHSQSQSLALLAAKATFMLLWLPYVVFAATCQAILRTNYLLQSLSTRHPG